MAARCSVQRCPGCGVTTDDNWSTEPEDSDFAGLMKTDGRWVPEMEAPGSWARSHPCDYWLHVVCLLDEGSRRPSRDAHTLERAVRQKKAEGQQYHCEICEVATTKFMYVHEPEGD